jgi:ferric-dicitrate binding protein FerR (iron transport regulator)
MGEIPGFRLSRYRSVFRRQSVPSLAFIVNGSARAHFLVSTPQVTVQAIGTVFEVLAAAGETGVTVLEGRVSILPPLLDETSDAASSRPTSLSAGERASVTREGKISIRRVGGEDA